MNLHGETVKLCILTNRMKQTEFLLTIPKSKLLLCVTKLPHKNVHTLKVKG